MELRGGGAKTSQVTADNKTDFAIFSIAFWASASGFGGCAFPFAALEESTSDFHLLTTSALVVSPAAILNSLCSSLTVMFVEAGLSRQQLSIKIPQSSHAQFQEL
mmetsp:Transcript_5730/g.8612  ORF Transcript_5730/g.8612 Transcript_5730/m.8612 type:complete len:105 (-) Transcript_5730:90-404(-)